ncbi:PH domain-containing protein [Pseudanabaena sp. PCC 6802]|uniref:PH domain-containing protein n=1 Tax=Pseudanabaena sp. PCC 6802 TaxID=118173 RepID=UPI00034BBCAA|nr:PH domain-containing protein [Pseudanabaena sp. PCC 6802]
MYSDTPRKAEIVFYEGRPAVIGSVPRLAIAIVTLGIGWLYFWITTNTTHYLITSQRILVETGLLSRQTNTLELYLIDDIDLEKPFGQRLMGTGNIILRTQDRSTPELHLERLPLNVRELYEQMRPAIEESKYWQRIRSREG